MLKASVIIPTYNRHHSVQTVLESLCKQSLSSEQFEIVVVDNCPEMDKELLKIISDYSKDWINYIHEPQNGLHHARHRGAYMANSDILVYIDDDVICPYKWLENILVEYEDENVVCVGGKTLPIFQGKVQNWILDFKGFLSLLDLGEEKKQLLENDTLYGCNFSIKKAVLIAVGGFNPDSFADPKLFWYRGNGESGLYRKIFAQQQNYKTIYSPQAWLHHVIPESRLNEKYIIKRACAQAVSDGFSSFRSSHGNLIQLFFVTLLAYLHSLKKWMQMILEKDPDKLKVQRIYFKYWVTRCHYGIKIFLDGSLRKHVLKKNYLPADTNIF